MASDPNAVAAAFLDAYQKFAAGTCIAITPFRNSHIRENSFCFMYCIPCLYVVFNPLQLETRMVWPRCMAMPVSPFTMAM